MLGWLQPDRAASPEAGPGEPVTGDCAEVLVVGAGLAGPHTATLLAKQGHDVLVVERRP